MPTPETIITLAAEGAGGSIQRARGADGAWTYWLGGTSMQLDENDDDYWESFESERVATLEEALALAGREGTWACLHPLFVHPDVAAEVWRLAEAAGAGIPEEVRRSYAMRRGDWFDACHPGRERGRRGA